MLNGIITLEEIDKIQNPLGQFCGVVFNGMTRPSGLFLCAAMNTPGSDVSSVFAAAATVFAVRDIRPVAGMLVNLLRKTQKPEPPLPYWGA